MHAQNVSGVVSDNQGRVLSYASVYIKGNTKGTTANSNGAFFLSLPAGNYTIVCAHVGYRKSEQNITVETVPVHVQFVLQIQVAELKDVVVKPNAEDPAYAIIRQAIKKRKDNLNELNSWQSTVYMKGMIRSSQVPKKILGIKIDPNRDIIDSTGKGILYFSESLTRYSRRLPKDYKEEVVSAKVSGVSQGFGFNSPHDIEVNLYENQLTLEGLNSRGFVSPIADNALYFYRFRYWGTFYEDGLEINKIQVIPRRKFEPCFAGGYINIIEGSWRIHSLDLLLTRESQMEVVDTVRITQQMFPVQQFWMPQQTSVEASFGIFGIKANARFAAVYSDYNVNNVPAGIFKGNIVKTIDTSANKKSVKYWDSIRPSPLTEEERMDYLKKDTLERKYNDPHYLDSLDKRANKVSFSELVFAGGSYRNRKQKISISYAPLLETIQYNTVEGWLLDISPVIRKWSDTGSFIFRPHFRYGFSSRHFNGAASISKNFGQNYQKRWRMNFDAGKYIFQVNPNNPIRPIVNSFATLLYKTNHMKIYEKSYISLSAQHSFLNGVRLNAKLSYEDRMPLDNTDTSYSWVKWQSRQFTSNYPSEIAGGNFVRHQALLTSATVTWQPGQQFVAYPKRLISLGSDWPTFTASFTKAWKGILGADADFGKWSLGVRDEFNMKLAGVINYNFNAGGFFNNANVQLPDWQHFNGNLTVVATEYTNSFQLAPYYANSTKDKLYGTANVEWHLNGLLTNKIPVIRRFNLGLVTGTNSFYVDRSHNYVEVFFGIENIFKTFRVDFVWGYDGFNQKPKTGIVIGMSGILTGRGIE